MPKQPGPVPFSARIPIWGPRPALFSCGALAFSLGLLGAPAAGAPIQASPPPAAAAALISSPESGPAPQTRAAVQSGDSLSTPALAGPVALTGDTGGVPTPAPQIPTPFPAGPLPQPPGGSAGAAVTGNAASIPLELDLSADAQSYDALLHRFVATGHVSALVAGGRLLADRLEIDTETRTVYAFGSIRLQRGQQYFQASRLRYSLIEGQGELQDAYGVLDLDGTQRDLDLTKPPSEPLPPAEPVSCPPLLPAPPQWHPYPWSVTAWTGQMFAANFGDTFLFKGNFRPEYMAGLGLQRRLLDAGPLALELDTNLLGHRAAVQPGGQYNQPIPNADSPAQSFGEITLGIGGRLWLQPWLNLYFVEGVSLLSEYSNWERTFRENYSTFLNYLAFEVEALVSPQWSVVGRIHHRSGAYGLYSGVREGSNGYLVGLRYRWGQSPPIRPSLSLPPVQGCPGAPPPGKDVPGGLPGQKKDVRPATPAAPSLAGDPWTLAREMERLRFEAIRRIDQRVSDVRYQQNLTVERRRGVPANSAQPDTTNQYGGIVPSQLENLNTQSTQEAVRGTISRWRIQARLLRFTPTTISGDRISFTNDPFTPAQVWMDSSNVLITFRPKVTEIKAARNRLRFEDRLPIAVTRKTKLKQEEIETKPAVGYDQTDRDGVFVGYRFPVRFGDRLKLNLEPQFMAERAINGTTNVYPLPGQPVASPAVAQPATTADLFGLSARLSGPLAGFESQANLEMTTFNPENIPDGTRSWGDLRRSVKLPLIGSSTWRLFGAYRYRIWNGTLGEQDVYSAVGTSLEKQGIMKRWGKLSSSYYWRIGTGNYQSNPVNSVELLSVTQGTAISSLNFSYPLWVGKPAAATPLEGLQNTPELIVPGLKLDANVLGTLAYYSTGTNQNTVTLSGGPTLTLGHFVKPFLDYTRLTIVGSGTLRQGLSPLGFEQAVDLGTIGIGLTQQIAGPFVFSGGIGYNIDPNSTGYGNVTGSYVELRWQRRAYDIGIYYSPYQGIGGIRIRLNDFNFRGTGVPYVPYDPARAVLDRPF